jgi:hypothetical protein
MPTPQPSINPNQREVDPARLAWGSYDHTAEDYAGQGDIHSSYSGDCIAMGQPVRKPFRFECEMWVTVGMCGDEADAYRMIPERLYQGTATTYADKVYPDQGEAARNDPRGFYDGMKVKHSGQTYVLCGPEVHFVGNAAKASPVQEQLGLFAVQEAA